MNRSRPLRLARLALSAFVLLLAACGGSDPAAPLPVAPEPAALVLADVGPAGGTVTGPDGVQVVIPPGALSGAVTIGIARSSAGAPADTPAENPPVAPVYEFTPHGLVFQAPVTVRMPAPAGAGAVFMAESGGDWEYQGATLEDGMVTWQRNSFSWGLVGGACAPRNLPPWSSSNPDPYPCVYPRGSTSVAATAPAAVTQLSAGDLFGSAGSWQVTQAGVVTFTLRYQAAPDCENPRARLIRWNPKANAAPQVVFEGPVPLATVTIPPPPGSAMTGEGGGTQRGVGTHSVDVSFSEADNTINAAGLHAFGYSFSCNRPGRPTQRGGDLVTVLSTVAPPPAATYSVGGNVSGLAAAGLVLQNNAGDDLAVTANGAFTFATPLAAGAAYAVTVKTQPGTQTCTVADGTGTASGNVTNVAVTCVAAAPPAWSVPLAVSAVNTNLSEPSLAAASDGGATLAWVQYDGAPQSQYNVYASLFSGGAWQAAQSIETLQSDLSSSLSGGAYSPVAAAAPGRSVVVYGFSPQTTTYQTALSRLSGGSWQSQILHGGANSHSGTVAMTGDGSAAVVLYAQHNGSVYALRSQTVDLATGSLVEQAVAPGSANEPAMAPMPGGDVLAVWANGSPALSASRYTGATQTWSAPALLDPGAGGAYPPSLAANGSGTAVASWMNLGNGYEVWAARYASGNWGVPVKLAPLAGERQVEDHFDYDLPSTAVGIDATGNAYVAWVQDAASTGTTAHVLVRRCPAAQALTSCEAAVSLGAVGEWAGFPSLVVAPDGTAWVAWAAELPSGDRELRVARRTAAGAWEAATTVATAVASDYAPALAVDGLNRVSVAWRSTDNRIYVSRTQ